MSNILDLRTVGNNTIYVVDDVPSAGAGTPAFVGSIAMFDGNDVAEISKATFTQLGSYYDVVGVGKAIQLYDGAGAGHYFWFNVTDGTNGPQTDPSLVGTGHQVDVLAADTAAQVATKFAAVVDALAGFSAPAPASTVVIITNAVGGAVTDISTTGAAATVFVDLQGSDAGDVGHLYLKIGPADVDWTEIATTDSQSLVKSGDYRRLAIYSADPSGTQLDDSIEMNTHPVDVIIANQSSRTIGIEYTIPNPGDSISAADFVLTEGNQTIYGDKTFGTSITPAAISIYGSLHVEGTLTYIDTVTLQVTDKLITLNKGGAASSADGAGIEFEEGGAITGYIKVNTTRDGFLFKAPAASGYGEFMFDTLTADRTYTWQDRDGIVALQANLGVDKQVAFYNANLLLDREAGSGVDALTWDYTNNYLGIRTPTPARPLDVNGSSIFRGALRIEAPTTAVNYEIFQAQVLTTDATPTTIQTLATTTDTVMLVEARILGKRTGGTGGTTGDSAAYIRTFRIKNVGGTVSIKHLDSMYTSEDSVPWNIIVAPSGTNAVISVLGAADNNITWDTTTIVQIL